MMRVTPQNWVAEVDQSPIPVVVVFGARWCAPCKILERLLDVIGTEKPEYKFVHVDIDEAGDLAARFGVAGVPRMVLLREGKVQGQLVGLPNRSGVLSFLDSMERP